MFGDGFALSVVELHLQQWLQNLFFRGSPARHLAFGRVSARTGWYGACILWLGGIASLIQAQLLSQCGCAYNCLTFVFEKHLLCCHDNKLKAEALVTDWAIQDYMGKGEVLRGSEHSDEILQKWQHSSEHVGSLTLWLVVCSLGPSSSSAVLIPSTLLQS